MLENSGVTLYMQSAYTRVYTVAIILLLIISILVFPSSSYRLNYSIIILLLYSITNYSIIILLLL